MNNCEQVIPIMLNQPEKIFYILHFFRQVKGQA